MRYAGICSALHHLVREGYCLANMDMYVRMRDRVHSYMRSHGVTRHYIWDPSTYSGAEKRAQLCRQFAKECTQS